MCKRVVKWKLRKTDQKVSIKLIIFRGKRIRVDNKIILKWRLRVSRRDFCKFRIPSYLKLDS